VLTALSVEEKPKNENGKITPVTDYIDEVRDLSIIEKKCFSMVHSETIKETFVSKLDGYDYVDVFLYGVVSECCVLQTVLDLIKLKQNDYKQIRNVYLVSEGIHSMVIEERTIAMERMVRAGGKVVSVKDVPVILDAAAASAEPSPAPSAPRLEWKRMVFVDLTDEASTNAVLTHNRNRI
jgi:nicotinamidase-related amidase